MPKLALPQFIETLTGQYPKLKNYDETRLFSVIMQAGVVFEFEFDGDGNTVVSYEEPGADAKKKLAEL
ncbi:MAG: hypothetical protein HY562_12770 [Ignavibacteriales bacterium]|nr:hypothetical protein [Ignavibacteriales bacterium]